MAEASENVGERQEEASHEPARRPLPGSFLVANLRCVAPPGYPRQRIGWSCFERGSSSSRGGGSGAYSSCQVGCNWMTNRPLPPQDPSCCTRLAARRAFFATSSSMKAARESSGKELHARSGEPADWGQHLVQSWAIPRQDVQTLQPLHWNSWIASPWVFISPWQSHDASCGP